MAAGEAKRFDADYPKQNCMVPSAGNALVASTVIQRTFNQIGGRAVLVAKPGEDFGLFTPRYDSNLINHTLVGDTLNCRPVWNREGNTVILYSDVFYTDAAIETIFSHQPEDFTLFTDGQDLFAMSFTPEFHDRMACALLRAVELGGNGGRDWELFRVLNGGIDKFPYVPEDGMKHLLFIGDRTQDFDTVEDYDDFLAGKSKNVLFNRK